MMATSHPQPGPTPAQIQAQQAAMAQQHELAKRRSRKPADKNIPDGLEEMVEGDLVHQYKALRDLERRMDAAMMRKKIDIQEAVNKSVKVSLALLSIWVRFDGYGLGLIRPTLGQRYRTLRIWISNTVENQPWQDSRTLDENTFDFSTGLEANYRVRIEGRILDDNDDDDEAEGEGEEKKGNTADGKGDAKMTENSKPDGGETMDHDGGAGQDQTNEQETKNSKTSTPSHKKFSHFLKSITIDFPQPGGAGVGAGPNSGPLHTQPQPPSTQIEWRKPHLPPPNAANPPPPHTLTAADFDALFFERKGDENTPITINIALDENPERFRLSPELSQLLDTDEGDRPSVVLGVWDYIKTLQLQEDDEKRTIRCDANLKTIFHRDTIYFPQIPDYLSPHLHPLPPIQLPYTIRVDQTYHTGLSQEEKYTIYDIPLLTPSAEHDPLRTRMMKLLQTTHHTHPEAASLARTLHATDDQLATLVQAMNQSKAKHAFFVEMSKDPVGFLQRWLGSQKRDLSVILGDSTAVARRSVEDVYPGIVGIDGARHGVAVEGGASSSSGVEPDRETGRRMPGRNGVWSTQEVRELIGLWLAR